MSSEESYALLKLEDGSVVGQNVNRNHDHDENTPTQLIKQKAANAWKWSVRNDIFDRHQVKGKALRMLTEAAEVDIKFIYREIRKLCPQLRKSLAE